jgi:hypothetical protein
MCRQEYYEYCVVNVNMWMHIFQVLCCESKCVDKIIVSSVVESLMCR